jgi:hypothetical protein
MQSYTQPSNIDFQSNNRKYVNHINRVRTIIREFERFKVAVMRVIPPIEGFNATSLLESAYKKLSSTDPFTDSKAGKQHWVEGKNYSKGELIINILALKYFEDSVDRIESEVSNHVRSQFEVEELSNQELVRLFATFSPILFRSKIRAGIKEYQARVINFLKSEVSALENDITPESSISGIVF